MSLRPLSYPEVTAGLNNSGISFISMMSTRFDAFGYTTRSDIPTTYFDFNTSAYCPRIWAIYCPYGGITPLPSEPLVYDGSSLPNYAHRIESIFDCSVGQTGGPGFYTDDHWAAGWHVFMENWDPMIGYVPNRYFLFNAPDSFVDYSQQRWMVDYALAYISPMNANNGRTVQFQGSNQAPNVRVVQPPIQGPNGRTDTSPGGGFNVGTSPAVVPSVQNDTSVSREFFFMASFLFDPNGTNPSPNYNPQLGIHNVISDTNPPFTHALTVKPRYWSNGDYEPISTNFSQPMPHGVVMSCWVRDLKSIGPGPHREITVSPIQSTYGCSTLSIVVKGGLFGPSHVQAF